MNQDSEISTIPFIFDSDFDDPLDDVLMLYTNNIQIDLNEIKKIINITYFDFLEEDTLKEIYNNISETFVYYYYKYTNELDNTILVIFQIHENIKQIIKNIIKKKHLINIKLNKEFKTVLFDVITDIIYKSNKIESILL